MPSRHEPLVEQASGALRVVVASAGLNANTPPHNNKQRTIGARMENSPMATVTYLEQSFLAPFWQDVIDFNAALIPVPLGAVSGSLGGFAFENVDGTYTVFLGDDIAVGNVSPISGTVQAIVRRSSLDPFGFNYAVITDPLSATGVPLSATALYEAFRGGGTELFASVLSGGDTVEIHSPASLGALAQSPLIETYGDDDVVFGSIYADTIYAGGGDDEVHGDRGDDTIYGEGGNDQLFGGRGADAILGQEGNDYVSGGDGADLIAGGPGQDGLHGNDGDDEIHGNSGNDDIYGEDGDDTIYGEDGNDEIFGGSGRDEIFGGDGDDYIEGGDHVDRIEGGRGADELRGNDGSDTIYGNGGDDLIFGGALDDNLYGGDGNDYIAGGDGGDFIEGGDDRDILIGGQGIDEISGGGAQDHIFGGDGRDYLRGNDGDDLIYGEDGDDLIWGGNDNDEIWGGAGFDNAFYNRPLAAYDVEIIDDGSVWITDLVGNGGADHLRGIERIVFADDVIDL